MFLEIEGIESAEQEGKGGTGYLSKGNFKAICLGLLGCVEGVVSAKSVDCSMRRKTGTLGENKHQEI
jgi:hypothetical protein